MLMCSAERSYSMHEIYPLAASFINSIRKLERSRMAKT